jgi:hypothetical protein
MTSRRYRRKIIANDRGDGTRIMTLVSSDAGMVSYIALRAGPREQAVLGLPVSSMSLCVT